MLSSRSAFLRCGDRLLRTLFHSVCIISIIRLPSLHLAATTPDPTWNNISIANWSCIELSAAITCASLSTLKPLISRLFPNLLPSVGSREYPQFTTGADVESSTVALETIGGSTSRSNSTGMTESDTDMIYKEGSAAEMREMVMVHRIKEMEDKMG